MYRSLLRLCAFAALSTGVAYAATGKPDLGNYVGSDSLAPAPSLPASFNTLMDVSTFVHTAVTMNLPADGDDANYAVSLTGNASLYGSALSNCFVSMNGYVVCGGDQRFYDNQALPDSRFGGDFLIAPFWDDLVPVAGTSAIDVYVKGGQTAIVQWTDFALAGQPATRLTFRVMFELNAANNRGAVAFQYIKMTGTGANGASATIGIQRNGAWTANQYAFNTAGATLTGTAGAGDALQSILYGYDTDGDRLNDAFESKLLLTDPTKHDTDGGGMDDGAELAAGKDPLAMGDDGATTDTDGDGISDASEMFYGTDKTKKDTDGDSSLTTTLDDNDEIYTTHTNPLAADTDGDGFSDSAEIDAATDPLDPTSAPSSDLHTINAGQYDQRAALDANNNVHIVSVSSNQNGVFYYMIDSTGKVLIPETLIKVPSQTSASHLRRPVIRVANGKVFIAYEIADDNRTFCHLGLVRINPANAPQDGSPVLGAVLTEQNSVFVPPVGNAREFDLQATATGVHLVYLNKPDGREHDNASIYGYVYAALTPDFALTRTVTMPLPAKSNAGGTHRWSHPYLLVGPDGTVHLVTLAATKKNLPQASILWASINGSTVKSYDIPLPVFVQHLGVAMHGNQIYALFGGGSHVADYHMMILDTTTFTASPVTNDFWKAGSLIDAESTTSFGPPFIAGSTPSQASITVLPNGAALGYFSHARGANDVCVVALLPDGRTTASPVCMYPGQNRGKQNNRQHGIRGLDLLPLGNGYVGFVHNSQDSQSLFYHRAALAQFNIPATPPAINQPPKITTMPPSLTVRVGSAFNYAAAATDPEGTTLTWSLQQPPVGMTVSASGTVTWTPTADQVGPYAATLHVCDSGTPQRCANQFLNGEVVKPSAPVITSQAPTNATVGQSWAYQVVVSDPDNDVTTYTLTAPSPAPGDMALSSTGLLTWTPTAKDLGSTLVTITVTDATGLTGKQTFSVLVSAPLDIDPVFRSTPSGTAVVGQLYAYTAVATDPADASATFTYSLVSTPSGNMTLSQDGKLSWTPTGSEKGTQAITIQAASSSGRTAQQSFAVTVLDTHGGCSCSVGGAGSSLPLPALLVLAALVLMLVRRKNA